MPQFKSVLVYVMALLYLAAGINHFWHPGFYINLIPGWLPWHMELVYASGVVEIALGLALLLPAARRLAAWGIVLMLVVFPIVHIHMVANMHLYPNISPLLLWLRLPLQGVLIAWAWWYTRLSVHLPDRQVEPASKRDPGQVRQHEQCRNA
jgi:uncharacterized membrane protein